MLREALLIDHRLSDRWRLASVLEEIAGALLVRERPEDAVELFAAADALREQLTAPIPPAEAADRDRGLDRLHSRLNSGVFASRWTDGSARTVDDAVDLAAQAIDHLDQAANTDAPPILTRREAAVLQLLTQGQTNREIGAALYISPSTAGVHVSNVLRKLGCRRRVDAAAQAHKLGITSHG
jgi:DNA-binding CsgD family transcriptional regulator